MIKDKNLIENTALMEELDYAVKNFKVIFLSGVIGCGKSVTVKMFTARKHMKVQRIICTGNKSDLLAEIEDTGLIIMEDIHLFDNDETCIKLLTDIVENASDKTRFLITSRGAVPASFRIFAMYGKLRIFTREKMSFTREMLGQYLAQKGIQLELSELTRLLNMTKGHPRMLSLIREYMQEYKLPVAELVNKAEQDFYDMFDKELFPKYSEAMQRFCIQIAPFEELSADLLELLDEGSRELLPYVTAVSSFILKDDLKHYTIFPIFHRYLLWKQRQIVPEQEIYDMNQKLGLYYEKCQNIEKAAYYLNEAQNYEKMAYVLEKNAKENHVGIVNYYALEKYYLALPESYVRNSPALLGGISMLHSICGRTEESEQYAARLEELLHEQTEKNEFYYDIIRFRSYLAIALPHRGIVNMPKYILDELTLLKNGKFKMPAMSITGNMPSLMSGGKDFCSWVRRDELLYVLIGSACENVFGKYGQGLPQIGLGESMYEKNKPERAISLLATGISKADMAGSIEMYFAGQAVMAKALIANGSLQEALNLMEDVKTHIIKEGATHLLDNLEAFIVRIRLNCKGQAIAERWMAEKAPNEIEHYYITRRYEYLVKVRLLIMEEKYIQARVLLERLYWYAVTYNRKFIEMETLILKSVLCYRCKDEQYKELMLTALQKAKVYHFVRLFADEGAAIYDILEEVAPQGTYYQEVLEATKKQMLMYMDYMQSEEEMAIQLTDQESDILRLLCRGKKNSEIAEIMSVTTYAVKYHLSNIYDKLQVNNRAAAINVAMEKGIVRVE